MTAPPEPETTPESKADPEENQAYRRPTPISDNSSTMTSPLTLFPTCVRPWPRRSFKAVVNFRTPRFDLDSLYGRGPDDQPYLYEEDGIRMLLGERMAGEPLRPGRGPAAPGAERPGAHRRPAQRRKPHRRTTARHLLAVPQPGRRPLGGKKHVSFHDVRDQVRWHYQWVLVNDFLPTILDKQTYNSVFPVPYRYVTTIPRLRENDLELMPVEFSVAAYRFGHSMIRPRYVLNPAIKRPPDLLPGPETDDLGGFRPSRPAGPSTGSSSST